MSYTLAEQVQRFIESGLKQSKFTKDIYSMLYIDTNKFIAHFDKSNFYERRFLNDADITASLLRDVKNPSIRPLCLELAKAIESQMLVVEVVTKRTTVSV